MSRVFISPSTQEHNAYSGGGNEEEWMRKLSSKVCTLLLGAGHLVKMGGTVSAASNAADSNAWNAQWHVAIHSNAGGGHGSEVWYYTGSTMGKRLASTVYPRIAAASNQPDRGIKTSTTYTELRSTKAPAIIVEVAFHDNLVEANEIKASLDEFARAIAQGIVDTVGGKLPPVVQVPPPVTPPPPTTPTPIPTWRVTEQSIDRIVLVRSL